MPHMGQAPGLSLSTPSHIGQKYFAFDLGGVGLESWEAWLPWQQLISPEAGAGSAAFSPWQQHDSFSAAGVDVGASWQQECCSS
ncbi:MAG TPA: hypothetical protein VGC39_08550 [Candidatus Methylacidiphilales bacterium]